MRDLTFGDCKRGPERVTGEPMPVSLFCEENPSLPETRYLRPGLSRQISSPSDYPEVPKAGQRLTSSTSLCFDDGSCCSVLDDAVSLAPTLATTTAEHGAVVSNGPGKFKIPWSVMEDGF